MEYNSFFLQAVLFALLALVLILSAISLFIKPAKRTIRASLVEKSTGHIIDISQSETSIGRAKTCDIVIPGSSVSRFHAVLSRRSTGWMIFDTNSTAGIILNGKRIEKKAFLEDGDKLKFGTGEYIFYSTAVTTKQQVVAKTKNAPADDRPKYKRVSNPSTAPTSARNSRSSGTTRKSTNNSSRSHKQ